MCGGRHALGCSIPCGINPIRCSSAQVSFRILQQNSLSRTNIENKVQIDNNFLANFHDPLRRSAGCSARSPPWHLQSRPP